MNYKIVQYPNLEEILDKSILIYKNKIFSLAKIVFDNGEQFHFILPSHELNPLFWDDKFYGVCFNLNENQKIYLKDDKIETLKNIVFEKDNHWEEYLEQYGKKKKSYLNGEHQTVSLLQNNILNVKQLPEWVQNDETPIDSKGQKMEFIAQIYIGGYLDEVDTDIFVFYSQTDNVIVQVYQLT